MNNVIWAKANVKSINDVTLPNGSSNKLRGDAISLGGFCVCDVKCDEIMETIFQGKNYIIINWFWK